MAEPIDPASKTKHERALDELNRRMEARRAARMSRSPNPELSPTPTVVSPETPSGPASRTQESRPAVERSHQKARPIPATPAHRPDPVRTAFAALGPVLLILVWIAGSLAAVHYQTLDPVHVGPDGVTWIRPTLMGSLALWCRWIVAPATAPLAILLWDLHRRAVQAHRLQQAASLASGRWPADRGVYPSEGVTTSRDGPRRGSTPSSATTTSVPPAMKAASLAMYSHAMPAASGGRFQNQRCHVMAMVATGCTLPAPTSIGTQRVWSCHFGHRTSPRRSSSPTAATMRCARVMRMMYLLSEPSGSFMS